MSKFKKGVDTPQELTLLEKFEQGWEIRYKGDGTIAVQVVRQNVRDAYIIEWNDGVVSFDVSEVDDCITCTPPKERKTLYLYEGDGKVDFFASSAKTAEFNLISEIHLEKNGDKWEVVNP